MEPQKYRFYLNENDIFKKEKHWLGGETFTRDGMGLEYLNLYNNGFMVRGFRPFPLHGWWRILRSTLELNNQTFNIWTHFLGILLVVYLLYDTMTHNEVFLAHTELLDRLVHAQFFFCIMYTFAVSVIFHTCNCAGVSTYEWVTRLDFSGVYVTVTSSGLTSIYYITSCHPTLRYLYIYCGGAVYLVVAGLGILSHDHSFRIRSGIFMCFFPVSFLLLLLGIRGAITREIWEALWKLFFGWLPYAVAFLFYVSKHPERGCNAPRAAREPPRGLCDCSLTSHSIWHFFGIVAALYQIHVLNWGWATFMGPAHSCERFDAQGAAAPGFFLSFYERTADWWHGGLTTPAWGNVDFFS